jgi:hypothetical protein
VLGRFAEELAQHHWVVVKRVFRYLARTKNLSLHLGSRPEKGTALENTLVGYVDSDFAGEATTGRSTTGWMFRFGIGPIAWQSKKQSITALSTADVEFIASAVAIQELLWFRELLASLLLNGNSSKLQPTVLYNNSAALPTFLNGKYRPHKRHINIKYLQVRKLIADRKEIDMHYCGTEEMAADRLTKGLAPAKQEEFVTMCGLVQV